MTRVTIDGAARVAALARADQPAEAALEVASFVYPHIHAGEYLGRLDTMAARVEGAGHLALRRVVAIAEGLGGNVDDYYHPDNSFLNRVLDTRRGIPITLSVIWIEVGRRAGLEMEGVGLPGHFLVYASGQLVDPFHGGEAIGFEEAAALVAESLGGKPRLDRRWLEPVSTVEIVARLVRNLDQVYRARGELHHLAWVEACREAVET
ncbi:MAG: transglutaminase family protein [Acidimicrobiia bacterium]